MNPINLTLLTAKGSQSPAVLAQITAQLELCHPVDIIAWAQAQYAPNLVLASSFGAEDMVLLDMLTRISSDPQVFYLDTGLLFPETYQLIETVRQKYGVHAQRVTPQLSWEQQEMTYGDALWKRNPDQCCRMRKVEPLTRYLQGKQAWITGIRRDQTLTRRHAPIVAFDEIHGLVKVNPLANWTEKDVFRYLTRQQVPYNPLHDQGYPSIGCIPCTQAINPGEDARSGRWAGQEKTECGLHQ